MYIQILCVKPPFFRVSVVNLIARAVLFISAIQDGELDEATVEGLVREFAASWKSGIEAINQDVLSFFSNFRNGMEILKQVMVPVRHTLSLSLVPAGLRCNISWFIDVQWFQALLYTTWYLVYCRCSLQTWYSYISSSLAPV